MELIKRFVQSAHLQRYLGTETIPRKPPAQVIDRMRCLLRTGSAPSYRAWNRAAPATSCNTKASTGSSPSYRQLHAYTSCVYLEILHNVVDASIAHACADSYMHTHTPLGMGCPDGHYCLQPCQLRFTSASLCNSHTHPLPPVSYSVPGTGDSGYSEDRARADTVFLTCPDRPPW